MPLLLTFIVRIGIGVSSVGFWLIIHEIDLIIAVLVLALLFVDVGLHNQKILYGEY